MEQLARALRERDRFLITTHVLQDGDAAGSCLAFRRLLRRMGKTAEIVLPSPLPRKFDFLAEDCPFHVFPDDWDRPEIRELEWLVALDFSQIERLGPMREAALDRFEGRMLCLDHHLSDGAFAELAHVDPKASSTAELIWRLMHEHLALELDRGVAEGLYTALSCETGSFRYGNTSPLVHRITADCLDTGLSPERFHSLLDERKTLHELKLHGVALERLRLEQDGRIGWIGLGPEVFAELAVTESETAGLVTLARSVEGVDIAILLYEDVPGSVKCSFRSKSDGMNMNRLAGRFGGGGHVRASGALVEGSLRDVASRILAAASELLS